LSGEFTVKKSSIKKIAVVVCIIILVSTIGYFLYENVLLPRSVLTENISQLQDEITSKTSEINQLNTQINDLQNQVTNLTQIIAPKNSNVVDLNNQITSINTQIEQTNQNITRLTNQLKDAQYYIKVLQDGIRAGPTTIVP
jgi:septal ring factor EnvC (AmiA/AmiB activator)